MEDPRKEERSPAFRFYAADYLADEDVQLMNLEQEGAYIRLMAYCWREGSIPADLAKMSSLCKGCGQNVVAVVADCFEPHPMEPDRLIHPRLERERVKQIEYRSKQATHGREGARRRWGEGDPIGTPSPEPKLQPWGPHKTLKASHGQSLSLSSSGGSTPEKSRSRSTIVPADLSTTFCLLKRIELKNHAELYAQWIERYPGLDYKNLLIGLEKTAEEKGTHKTADEWAATIDQCFNRALTDLRRGGNA